MSTPAEEAPRSEPTEHVAGAGGETPAAPRRLVDAPPGSGPIAALPIGLVAGLLSGALEAAVDPSITGRGPTST